MIYFAQYEDENNSWNLNGTMSWTGVNPINTTEFIWGRSAQNEIDIRMLYEGTNRVSVYGLWWTNGYPDTIEIFSEYQGINTGGIGIAELTAPAIPEPSTTALIVTSAALVLFALKRQKKT
jgi:hypothetical protein